MNYKAGFEFVDNVGNLHETITRPQFLMSNKMEYVKYLPGEWYYTQGHMLNYLMFYVGNLISYEGAFGDFEKNERLQQLTTMITNTIRTYQTITVFKAVLLLTAIGSFHSHMISQISCGVISEEQLAIYNRIICGCRIAVKESDVMYKIFKTALVYLKDHLEESNGECIKYAMGDIDPKRLN